MKDTRIVYGSGCTWWDDITKIGTRFGLPCCPHCKCALFEVKNEAEWFNGVDKYEAAGNPGYRAFIEWLRGKCLPDYDVAKQVYEAREVK